MQCPQCQRENPPHANFCLHCGTRLATVCPQCQQVLPPEARFCLACGHALTAVLPLAQTAPVTPQPATLPTPEAERRQLTVLFCDLADSTRLARQLDPEDLREMMRAYQVTCVDVIQHFAGYVAQYLGDGLLVYFGYPQAHEDDAQRAVHTGLGMLEAMGTLNARLVRDHGIRLTVRIGIHTGLVVIGEMGSGGRHEHLALGDTPNLAARLQGLAEPDTVVISAATSRLVQG
jgi:class 3 adenylate cyclase